MTLNLPDGTNVEIRRMVVKLGTKQITDLKSVKTGNLRRLVDEMAELKSGGLDLIVTASGAIGLGVQALYGDPAKLDQLSLPQKQALAGLGQLELMKLFQQEFARHGIRVGQVLLTYAVLDNRTAYQNASNTLNAMLDMGIVPIINENDSVAVDEIKVGDNDRLGAYVSQLVNADLYVMLTDIDGFYEHYGQPGEKLLPVVSRLGAIEHHAKKQTEKYTKGGMISKLQAVRTNSVNAIYTAIANGNHERVLHRILADRSEGTLFLPEKKKLNSRKKWITGKRAAGSIQVDAGAAHALTNHKSLLASGIVRVSGIFRAQDKISILGPDGREIAVGLANYSSEQIGKIAGKKTGEMQNLLGGDYGANCVVHVDNMVLYEK